MAKHNKDAPADTLEELESIGERLAQWVAAYCDGRREEHPLVKPEPRMGAGS